MAEMTVKDRARRVNQVVIAAYADEGRQSFWAGDFPRALGTELEVTEALLYLHEEGSLRAKAHSYCAHRHHVRSYFLDEDPMGGVPMLCPDCEGEGLADSVEMTVRLQFYVSPQLKAELDELLPKKRSGAPSRSQETRPAA